MSYTLIKAANRYAVAQIKDETFPGEIVNANVYRHKYQEYRNLFLQNAMQRNVMRIPKPANGQAYLNRVRKAQRAQQRAGYRVTAGAGYTRTAGFYGRFSGAGAERKFHDVDFDDAVVASGGTVTASINLIPQGVTEKTRVGRKATLKTIQWNYTVSLPEVDAVADPAGGDILRVILFMDKQCNGATATVTGILESADYQSFLNLANSGRFRILSDKRHSLNYTTLASDGAGVVSSAQVQREHTLYKSCNIPLEFDATTGAITEIRSNNVGVLLISKNNLAGFASKFRMRFTDGA